MTGCWILASAIIRRVRAINLMMGNKGFNLGKKLDVVLNPFKLVLQTLACGYKISMEQNLRSLFLFTDLNDNTPSIDENGDWLFQQLLPL